MEEEFEDTKWSNPQIEGQTTQWSKEKGTKAQTTIYKTLHRSTLFQIERLNVQNIPKTKSKVRNYKEHTKHRL